MLTFELPRKYFFESAGIPTKRTGASARTDLENQSSRFNHRQLDILDYLKNHRFINVGETSTILQVSQITACRDLKGLVLEKN